MLPKPAVTLNPVGVGGGITCGWAEVSFDSAEVPAEFDPKIPFRDHKERWNDTFERRYLTWLLGRADGNISKAARDADMDRKYLHKLLKKHGIVTDVGPVEED